jgi:hypothetical protein
VPTLKVTTRLAQDVCPYCGHLLDSATAMDDAPARPKPGDVTMCIKCGFLLVFDDTMRLTKPDEALLVEAMEHPDVKLMLRAWRETYGGGPQ